MYDEDLAFTGLGGITIGGVVLGYWWLAAVAAALVVVGLMLTRIAARGTSPAVLVADPDQTATLPTVSGWPDR
jgi:hypothetical protein